MRIDFPVRLLPLALCTCLFHSILQAQDTVGVQVSSLTSAERDAVLAGVRANGQLNVVYTCVPAGIMVFTAEHGSASREALRTSATNALTAVVAAQRINGTEITLHVAQAACELTRGQ
ncbi:MAG: hypothetical protein M9900_06985 [Flavobacteriales bacterium]|nr:hypothetical protein [Flavobacteriales bacterium]